MKEVSFYVIEDKQNLLGCVYLEDKGKTMHFGLLTVHRKWRGTGLAPAIMRSIEQYAHSNGYKVIELDYMSLASWLKKYYEDYGFHATGEITPWGNIDLTRMIKKI